MGARDILIVCACCDSSGCRVRAAAASAQNKGEAQSCLSSRNGRRHKVGLRERMPGGWFRASVGSGPMAVPAKAFSSINALQMSPPTPRAKQWQKKLMSLKRLSNNGRAGG